MRCEFRGFKKAPELYEFTEAEMAELTTVASFKWDVSSGAVRSLQSCIDLANKHPSRKYYGDAYCPIGMKPNTVTSLSEMWDVSFEVSISAN